MTPSHDPWEGLDDVSYITTDGKLVPPTIADMIKAVKDIQHKLGGPNAPTVDAFFCTKETLDKIEAKLVDLYEKVEDKGEPIYFDSYTTALFCGIPVFLAADKVEAIKVADYVGCRKPAWIDKQGRLHRYMRDPEDAVTEESF